MTYINSNDAKNIAAKFVGDLHLVQHIATGFGSYVFRSLIDHDDSVIKVPIKSTFSYQRTCDYYSLLKSSFCCPQNYKCIKFEGIEILVEEYIDVVSINMLPKTYRVEFELYKALGQSIAHLHSNSMDSKNLNFPNKINFDIDKYCSKKNTIKYFGSQLSKSIQNQLHIDGFFIDPIICHGDLHSKNIFFYNSRFVFIDPDPKIDCSHWDIARLLSSFVHHKERAVIFHQIITGYSSIRAYNPTTLISIYLSILIKKMIKGLDNNRVKSSRLFSEIKYLTKNQEEYFNV